MRQVWGMPGGKKYDAIFAGVKGMFYLCNKKLTDFVILQCGHLKIEEYVPV